MQNFAPSLTGVAQQVGCHPTKQKVTGLIPSQGTRCLLYTSDAADDIGQV